jgi:hypothetical protein
MFTFRRNLAPAFGRHCGCIRSGDGSLALALTLDRRPFALVGLLAFGVR